MGKLDGKVAVITGSGRGIGRAVAVLFATEGAKVVVNDIDGAPAQAVVKEIQALGKEAVACVSDITKAEGAEKLIETAGEKFGKLDILVNNAGITRDALISRMTDAQWDICLNLNLRGTFNCIRAASRYMMKKGHGGRVINMASVAGLMGNVGQANYASAKAGIIGLTKTMAKEWARYNITCNAIAYGLVDTRLTKEKEAGEEVMGEKVGIPQKIRDMMMEQSGGQVMTPEEAAKPVLFLASDDAAFITGNVLNASSGMYI